MKISIITATYNSSATLRDTLESILSQSYADYECIVVDGASKDATLDIIRQYEPRLKGRLRWVSEPDKGIYDAMNKGIALATGDIVGILNSDDFYAHRNVLKQINEAFAQNDALDAVYADVDYVAWDDTSKHRRHYSSRVFHRWMMRLGWMPAHPTFYCKRSAYERFARRVDQEGGLQYFDTSYKIAADFENLLRMIFVGRISTHYIHDTWVKMREGGASSSGAASHRQINRDHMRAFRENGVYSNYALISLRYIYKCGEVAMGKVKG